MKFKTVGAEGPNNPPLSGQEHLGSSSGVQEALVCCPLEGAGVIDSCAWKKGLVWTVVELCWSKAPLTLGDSFP